MGRPLRTTAGGLVYHLLNRANARMQIFDNEKDYDALRRRANRGQPYGSDPWGDRMTKRFGLQSLFRPQGRPRKKPQNNGS